MSETVNTFTSKLDAILSQLAGPIGTANMELSDGTKRGKDILHSIQTYGTDLSRDRAKAAVTIINGRIALAIEAANDLEPIDFDAVWPEEKGDSVQAVIAAETPAEPEAEPEPDPEALSEPENE